MANKNNRILGLRQKIKNSIIPNNKVYIKPTK